ncbi:MAG TPA: hypothetical protein VG295_08610, partial [Solirubrobacteraceae bacterium]|nr:hypothetical protein [Solirubrobacteraceae bacterium]
LDGGLAAALIVYGASPAAAVAAVLVYHALALWIPALCGLVASARLARVQPRPALRGAAHITAGAATARPG